MSFAVTLPPTIPPGWQTIALAGFPSLARKFASGLAATFTVEIITDQASAPGEIPGVYRRLVLSRRDRYPGWDEMRDLVRSCGLFDRRRDVIMLLPPDAEYVNVHENCFHWWQRDVSLWAHSQLIAVHKATQQQEL